MPAAIPDEALCAGCNYALRGLAEFRCPECGRLFDPDRPLTMNLGRPLTAAARAALRPIGRWAAVWMGLAAVFGVLGPAWLTPSREMAASCFLLWVGFFIACWLRHAVRRSAVAAYRQPRELLRVDAAFDRRARTVFAAVLFLVLTRAPFLLTLLASRPSLDPLAHHLWAEVPTWSPVPRGPMVRGLVVIKWISVGSHDVTFDFYGGGRFVYKRNSTGDRLAPDYFPDWENW